MAVRYIDTGFYKSPFVRGLKGSLKSLYSFIITDCNGSGIWAKDLEVASIYTGFKYTDDEFSVFEKNGKAIDLKDGKYFFPDFLEHQYPKGLSENNPAQKNFILELKKYNLIGDDLKPLQRPFKDPIQGSHVYVKVTGIGNGNGNKGVKGDFNFRDQLIKNGAEENLIDEWMDVRKKKKATNSETAFNGFMREVDKYGKGINEVLRICVEKSWKGFSADWLDVKEGKSNSKFEAAADAAETAKAYFKQKYGDD